MIEIDSIPHRVRASLDILVPCKTIELLRGFATAVSHLSQEGLRVLAAIDKARGR